MKYCNTTGLGIYKQSSFRYLTDSLSLLESVVNWYLHGNKNQGMTITKNFFDKSNDYYLFH